MSHPSSAMMSKRPTAYDTFADIDSHPDRVRSSFRDIRDPFFWEIYERFKPYSLISIPRFNNLFNSIRYIAQHNIPGDIIECGVYLGGAMAAMGAFASHFGLSNRKFWLFDTFEGFPSDAHDVDIEGTPIQLAQYNAIWSSFRDWTQKTLDMADFGNNKIEFVQGYVEETLPITKIEEIALLRLDTDYYESTKLELEILYPKIVRGGVVIIDDYGHFEGARRAVDEYFAETKHPVLLNRIDYSGLSGVKL